MAVALDKTRRHLLQHGLALAAVALVGCGGAETDAQPVGGGQTSAPPPASPWVVTVPTLLVGGGASFDLAQTLPPDVVRGGVFGIDPSGAPLPSGMLLNANGTLSVGSASVGTVAGVLFTYDEP